ncbi:hypothetical protein [Cardinium endosymbiont of Nabis limbatus]|uniref:hypothetical protein n=1 Tax=Cardinium endosymbiont of Nabis limbatus TaxID=3066217 RepID=UPI003AF3744F
MKMNILIGFLAMVVFLSGDGARALYSSFFLFKKINPFLVIFTASFISLLVTLIIAFVNKTNHTKAAESNSDKHRRLNLILNYVMLNIFTVLNLVTGYLSIGYIIPAVSSAIAVSVGPMLHNLLRFNKTSSVEKWLSFLLFILSAQLLLSDASVIALRKGSANIIIGFSLSLVCGIAVLCNTVICKRLSSAGEFPLRINTLRSILVLVVTFFLCIKNNLFSISQLSFYHLIVFALFFVLVPQICLQLAIKNFDVGLTSLGIAAAPIFSAIVQVLFFDAYMGYNLGVLLCMNSLVIGSLSFIQIFSIKRVEQQ